MCTFFATQISPFLHPPSLSKSSRAAGSPAPAAAEYTADAAALEPLFDAFVEGVYGARADDEGAHSLPLVFVVVVVAAAAVLAVAGLVAIPRCAPATRTLTLCPIAQRTVTTLRYPINAVPPP